MDSNHIYQGHTLELLKQLDSDSIDCIITSPPYYGLRAYPNSETIWQSKENMCWFDVHIWETTSSFCNICGAWKGQLGLEPDYKMYLNHMLQITAQLKRVLKPSGTLWWNMGDTYAGSGGAGGDYNEGGIREGQPKYKQGRKGDIEPRETNIPDKCLMQLPERLAIRMVDEQDWILRNAIIWHKPNHMPSSVKDRLAGSYEFVHLFVKNKKYHFDLDAIREPAQTHENRPYGIVRQQNYKGKYGKLSDDPEALGEPRARNSRLEHAFQGHPPTNWEKMGENLAGKNPGDILEDFWTITTQPHPFAHFAVYPERLVEPMIKAGCPKNGIVLDPFAGSATTCLVAEKLKRNWIGFEINPEYIKIAEERLRPYVNQVKL